MLGVADVRWGEGANRKRSAHAVLVGVVVAPAVVGVDDDVIAILRGGRRRRKKKKILAVNFPSF